MAVIQIVESNGDALEEDDGNVAVDAGVDEFCWLKSHVLPSPTTDWELSQVMLMGRNSPSLKTPPALDQVFSVKVLGLEAQRDYCRIQRIHRQRFAWRSWCRWWWRG